MFKIRYPSGWLVFLGAALLVPSVVSADTCDVPSAYPTIQAAVDDFNCTQIFVASGRFYGDLSISRSVEIQGVSSAATTVLGRVWVEGSGTQLILRNLRVERSPDRLLTDGLVTDGYGEILPDGVLVDTSLIFRDGFESGTTSAWTLTH